MNFYIGPKIDENGKVPHYYIFMNNKKKFTNI